MYPLPFIDRIEEAPTDQEWDAVWLENGVVRLMILPQLGGRIHVGQVGRAGRGLLPAGSRGVGKYIFYFYTR